MDRIRQRFASNYIGIILTVVSIIQGIALSSLVAQFSSALAKGGVWRDYALLAHFTLSFVVLLRVFQTYVTAALDYEDLKHGFMDILVVFVVGALQFIVFDALTPARFNVKTFHIRFVVLTAAAVVGYACAWHRVRGIPYERRLQLVNIAGVLVIGVMSMCIILLGPLPKSLYATLALVSTAVLVLSMHHSLSATFSYPPDGGPQPTAGSQQSSPNGASSQEFSDAT